ncbi:tRNA pseudouridine(38-40) synthase TruA [Marinicella sp. S1101]|uniref:tRNA pseudouridine(38-40) synthase TruA n=1 Tax=Marinicella marina TaxID=2996016 RepID=UPI002260D84F|nr:tRNA pseudouridine(38-40) synthase TruA [Marinicella marina]MCX7554441.1 tRNA pseudouridine(38-40) synthase TruA [Marinicella marina]MDJ1140592.1 tRNA pseudouridine(38-40) synthase TruA [Marinicella marina]
MRIAFGVEYDGQPFYGFQTQKQEPTVQSCLEKAVSKVANHPVRVICAGRTDTGVSATQQIIHFETTAVRTPRQWVLGVNTAIHEGVSVLWAKQVDDTFHARFSATSRSYQYRILCRKVRPAINRHQLTWVLPPLDHKKMHEAAQYLLGEHDFNAFRSSKCQANNPVRTMHEARVYQVGDHIICEFRANAFLHHMIRNIVGTLLKVGKAERPVQWVEEVLLGKDRTKAGMTAPPNGLMFTGVTYPHSYRVPPNETD